MSDYKFACFLLHMKLTRNRDPTNIILALKLTLVDFCVIRHGQFLHCVFYSDFASIFKVISPVIRLILYYCTSHRSSFLDAPYMTYFDYFI